MGHGPSLSEAIKDKQKAEDAVNQAVAKATAGLKNTETQAVAYINSHTPGIIETGTSTYNSYSKFSEDYSLGVLDGIINGLVKTATDYVNPLNEATKVADMMKDIGGVMESVLALFAASSNTTSTLQITFNHILSGDKNYAVYYAANSTIVHASNVWGNKEITVVANAFLLAQVKVNPEVTYAKIYQEDLDTLDTLNQQYDAAIVAAQNEQQLDHLSFYQNKINLLKTKIQGDLTTELAK